MLVRVFTLLQLLLALTPENLLTISLRNMGEPSGKSKKRSGGSRPNQSPPEEFVLFLDENLCNCQPILKSLEESGVKYERHLDHWPAGTPDEQWIPKVGEKGWILLTRDQNMRYNELELRQITLAKVREFVILGGNLNKNELAELVAAALPAMMKVCGKLKPPFIVSISKLGSLALRYPRKK